MTESKVHLKIADELRFQARLLMQKGFDYDAHMIYGIADRVELNEKDNPDMNTVKPQLKWQEPETD